MQYIYGLCTWIYIHHYKEKEMKQTQKRKLEPERQITYTKASSGEKVYEDGFNFKCLLYRFIKFLVND